MTSENTTFKPIALRTPTAHGVLSGLSDSDEIVSNPTFEWHPTVEIAAFAQRGFAGRGGDIAVLGATGRDKLQLTDLRGSPKAGMKQASVRLTGSRMWLTVSAQAADVDALGAHRVAVSSLWLAAAVATRERAMETGEAKHLWLLGLDDTQLLEAKPDGWINLQEVATGLNRLVDLVQNEMSLHFRSSAFDLLFNEEFEWDQAPEAIIEHFVAELKTAFGERSKGEELAVVGLGPRLGPFAESLALAVDLTPWRAPALWGTPNPHFTSFESWLLQRAAPREGEPPHTTAVFGGAPLLLPRPVSEAEIAAAALPDTPIPDETEPDTDATAASPGKRRPPRRRRRRFGSGWLRHHGHGPKPDQGTESNLRKVLFVIAWVAAVVLAGHLIVEQSTEQARMQQ